MEERVLPQLGQDVRRDSAADVDAAGGKEPQGEIARLGPVDRDHQIERLCADRVAAGQPRARDRGGGVAAADRAGEPGGLRRAAARSQKAVEGEQADAGADRFVADVAVRAGEEGVELDLQAGARAEVAVASFGGERVVALPVPDESCFAEAGAGGDHGQVSAD